MLDIDLDHTIEQVYGLLTDPEFIEKRSLALGDLSCECQAKDEGDTKIVTSTRTVKRDLPGFLSKIFPSEQEVKMVERWTSDGDGGWNCKQEVAMTGQPVSIKSDLELFPTGSGCCLRFKAKAKVSVPLIGGKAEKFVVEQMNEGVEKDMEYVDKTLKG